MHVDGPAREAEKYFCMNCWEFILSDRQLEDIPKG